MNLDSVIDRILQDIQTELDGAEYSRRIGNIPLAYFSEGYADGLRKALRYIEILQETEKTAMPASTAADPLEKGDNDLQ